MGEAYFYHLTDSPVAQTLLSLLPRALGQGWRVEVRGTASDAMEKLDLALWLGPEESFLPHGLAGSPGAADQPVLLSDAPAAGRFDCLMSIDGAAVAVEEASRLTRVCVLFDGHDPAAVDQARTQWRSLTAAGLGAKYWAQDGGNWVMRQERAPQS